MIDIDITLIWQLANFIVLLIVLNFVLFKPVRQIMLDREQGISSALGDSKAAQERMQSILENYNSSLAEAKQKAASTYSTIYQEGLDTQRDMISAEREKASELLDKARNEISEASTAARADLKNEADRLSKEITSKLLGRAV
jgi:F-type H+-transporting ATPase subunit b